MRQKPEATASGFYFLSLSAPSIWQQIDPNLPKERVNSIF